MPQDPIGKFIDHALCVIVPVAVIAFCAAASWSVVRTALLIVEALHR